MQFTYDAADELYTKVDIECFKYKGDLVSQTRAMYMKKMNS